MARKDFKTIGIWPDTLAALNDYIAKQIKRGKLPRITKKPQVLHDLVTEARKKAGLPAGCGGRPDQTGL